jgi:hypothetical protein
MTAGPEPEDDSAIEPGATYETKWGIIKVTGRERSTVTYSLTMPDGTVIENNTLPLVKFQRTIAPPARRRVATALGSEASTSSAAETAVLPMSPHRYCTKTRALTWARWLLVVPAAILGAYVASLCAEWLWDATIGSITEGPKGHSTPISSAP